MNTPKLDTIVGMDLYSTAFLGTGGAIKRQREDFEVSEALSEKALSGIAESDGYAVYELKKDGIDTNHALAQVQKKTGARLKALGLKDSRAVTSQYVCAISKAVKINQYDGGKFTIRRVGYSKRPLTAKDMVGNTFSILVSDAKGDIADFDEYEKILNYFGYQRFGSARPVSHTIGKCIMQKDYGGALRALLSETSEYDSKERTKLREQLADASNFSQMLGRIPRDMDLERAAVSDMIDGGTEESAIRTMPSKMRRFFVQAFQSYVFNRTLTAAIRAGENLDTAQEKDVCFNERGILEKSVPGQRPYAIAVPMAGHSYYAKTRFDYYIRRILKEEEISFRDFFVPHMQEAGIEGGFRMAHAKCSNPTVVQNRVKFTLSRGSYATVVLREIVKPECPVTAGFA